MSAPDQQPSVTADVPDQPEAEETVASAAVPILDDDSPEPEQADGGEDDSAGQVSTGPNSFGNAETSAGGADAVPDTPDMTPSVELGDGPPSYGTKAPLGR